MNREEWLQNATQALRVGFFAPLGSNIPEVRVSVGFPKSGGKGNVIGQCWSGLASADSRPQIFIHPSLVDSVRVLDVLAHELVHATVGTECGHKGAFKALATSLGLEGKMTATVAGAELAGRLNALVSELGEYPHAMLDPKTGGKKQTTRLVKCSCESCGYVVRTSRKWLEESGAPWCPCQIELLMNGEDTFPMTIEGNTEDE